MDGFLRNESSPDAAIRDVIGTVSVGKAIIQPRRGHGAAKVHVFSLYLMDALLGDADPSDPYDFATVERWCDSVPGGISSLDEIFIPVTPTAITGTLFLWGYRQKDLWDSLGL